MKFISFIICLASVIHIFAEMADKPINDSLNSTNAEALKILQSAPSNVVENLINHDSHRLRPEHMGPPPFIGTWEDMRRKRQFMGPPSLEKINKALEEINKKKAQEEASKRT